MNSVDTHDDAIAIQNESYTLKSEDLGKEMKSQDNGNGVTIADETSKDDKKTKKNEKVQMSGVIELVSSISIP